MKAQIIVIGDELLAGRICDTNTQKIAQWLEIQGFKLQKVTLTSDDPRELTLCLERAWKEADLILTTGGLGPTEDDMTKKIIGDFFGAELCENAQAVKLAKEHYARIDKQWNREMNGYHLIPQGLEPVVNPAGLAPGLAIHKEGKLLLSAPGVPRELVAMLEAPFIDHLDQAFPQRENNHRVMTIRTVGVPEEKIFHEYMPNLWHELSQHGKVSSLPQNFGVDIHVAFSGSEKDLQERTQQWRELLAKTPLAEHIWSYEFKSIEEVVLEKARAKNLKIGLAESCTGGLVANRLTNVPGASSHFYGGIVAYHNEVKANILGVRSETLNEFGAVSEATAQEMASGALKALNADVAISLTGIAGPGGGTVEKPVGLVCIGGASREKAFARAYQFRGSREFLKQRFSEAALHQLRRLIDHC